ncbi:MAG TPA: helix-turn-helix domain-containing protein [Candidatus Thermoplasmatota archaeon]|nr:helix-turn-helix domain-containing protein [Candidatus Thermoplasmatota archaeon]
MAFELLYRIVLTSDSRVNRPLFGFMAAHPEVRWSIRDIYYTGDHAWYLTRMDAPPAALQAVREAIPSFHEAFAVEHHIVAEGPNFLVYYEKLRAPQPGEEEFTWHLISQEIGPGALIRYDGIPEGARVQVIHESRDALTRFFGRILAEDAYREVQFDALRPVESLVRVPDLTAEESTLLSLVWRAGYYERPRRVTLRDLALVTGVPFTTLGYRLRGIEAKSVARALAQTGALPLRSEGSEGSAPPSRRFS